jgi:mRNA-degrading endonuclease RelE of RelBE toxin-antitoxin system
MKFKVHTTPNFEKEAKKLIKKYSSLKNEISILIDGLKTNPFKGTHLGNNIYKIRIAIASKGKGKRSGARIITQVRITHEVVYLFSIYNKGDKNNITNQEIGNIISSEL